MVSLIISLTPVVTRYLRYLFKFRRQRWPLGIRPVFCHSSVNASSSCWTVVKYSLNVVYFIIKSTYMKQYMYVCTKNIYPIAKLENLALTIYEIKYSNRSTSFYSLTSVLTLFLSIRVVKLQPPSGKLLATPMQSTMSRSIPTFTTISLTSSISIKNLFQTRNPCRESVIHPI